MGHGALGGHGHGEHVLLRVLHALLDGGGHFLGLAHAHAHTTVAVAHDHEGRQLHAAAALHGLGDAVDEDDALLQLGSRALLLLAVVVTSHMPNPF